MSRVDDLVEILEDNDLDGYSITGSYEEEILHYPEIEEFLEGCSITEIMDLARHIMSSQELIYPLEDFCGCGLDYGIQPIESADIIKMNNKKIVVSAGRDLEGDMLLYIYDKKTFIKARYEGRNEDDDSEFTIIKID